MRLASESSQVIPTISDSDIPSSTNHWQLLEIEFEEDKSNNILKPQNCSALTITELLNPIQPTSPIQLRDYDSDSESNPSELNFIVDNDGSTYDHATNTIADYEDSTALENGLPQNHPQYPDASNCLTPQALHIC